MKNPVTAAGIEPATFQFVAQHLNHCATAVPTDPYLAMVKVRCGIPNAYILDITMYKMHVSFVLIIQSKCLFLKL